MTYDPWAKLREQQTPPPIAAPLATLQELGLTRDAPLWWRNEDRQQADTATHILHPRFLSANDLRQLAALTLEGYDVRTFPRRDHIKVVVTKKPS